MHFETPGSTINTLHERNFPHAVTEGIWMWSVFSEEKDLDFNGYLVQTGPDTGFIVDPPCAGPAVLDGFASLPKPEIIIITNRDHERAVADFRKHFNIMAYAPDADAKAMEFAPDCTYQDGHMFPGGWQAIHLPGQKSPGESALYNAERKMLILGDALIGKPFQQLSMLPADKYANKQDAVEGLQRLTGLDVKAVLVCDGDPIFLNADALLADALLIR